MQARAEKGQANQYRAAAAEPSKAVAADAPLVGFVDNRVESAQLQKLQSAADNGPQALRLSRIVSKRAPLQMAKLGAEGLWSARKYVEWYFRGSDAQRRKGDALREIYTQIGVDLERDEGRRTKAKLKQDGKIDDTDIADLEAAVEAYLGGGKEALPRERKTLSAKTWKHIWRGDFNPNKNKATGYHWKGDAGNAWLEGTGDAGAKTNGFYEETVKVRGEKVEEIVGETGASRGNVRDTVKDDKSTFFPDDWSQSEVKDAIELRDTQGSITTKTADGVTLVKSGDTIYPTLG